MGGMQSATEKRFDPSFAKFLLCHEFGFGEENTEGELTVTVEVVE